MRRLPFDPKLVKEIQGSPEMSREQGPAFMQAWGGPSQYMFLSRLPMEERLTYTAVQEGYATKEDIRVVTGLTSGEVSRALTSLGKKGLVKDFVAEPVKL